MQYIKEPPIQYTLGGGKSAKEPIINYSVYILQGKYDYQVSYRLAKAYFDSIDAPQKEFFTFEESAHSPNLEDSQQFVGIVRSISEK